MSNFQSKSRVVSCWVVRMRNVKDRVSQSVQGWGIDNSRIIATEFECIYGMREERGERRETRTLTQHSKGMCVEKKATNNMCSEFGSEVRHE